MKAVEALALVGGHVDSAPNDSGTSRRNTLDYVGFLPYCSRMPTDRQQQIRRLTHEVAELQRRLADVMHLCLELQGGGAPPPGPVSHTATARIRDLFRGEPERVWSLADLERTLRDVGRQTVRATVGRLAREGDTVEVVERGRYQFLRT